jgi:DNA polymerase III epsilon subunit-like protein
MLTGEELKMHALHFHSLGLNMSCISNKKNQFNFLENDVLKAPSHTWKHLETSRQELTELNSYDWENATGLGIILGHNNIMALDIDCCISPEFISFVCAILELPENYPWIYQSGSRLGYHIVFYCDLNEMNQDRLDFILQNLFSTRSCSGHDLTLDAEFGKCEVNSYRLNNSPEIHRFEKDDPIARIVQDRTYSLSAEKIEFKWKGNLTIPPSLHRSGADYQFINQIPRTQPIAVSAERIYMLRKLICYGKTDSSQGVWENWDFEPSYIVFDTETNGLPRRMGDELNYEWPRMLQLAWFCCDERENIVKSKLYSFNIPGLNIDEEGSRIHGLTEDKLCKIGVDLIPVLSEFIDDISKCMGIVSHNVDFDYNIVKNELLRHGMFADWIEQVPRFCTMKNEHSIKICQDNSNSPEKYPKIIDLFNAKNHKSLVPIHSALFDAYLVKIIFPYVNKPNANNTNKPIVYDDFIYYFGSL